MKRTVVTVMFLFALMCFAFLLHNNASAYPFNKLAPLPNQFGTAYSFNSGVVVCYQSNNQCTHIYWASGSMTPNEITYGTDGYIRMYTPWRSSAPYWKFGSPASDWTWVAWFNAPSISMFQGYGTTFADACTRYFSSDENKLMRKVGSSPALYCKGANWISLSIILSPQAGGGVASSPFGINCGLGGTEVCQKSYNVHQSFEMVELEAFPNNGWEFGYWYLSEGNMQFSDNPHTITMDGAKTLTAKFFKTFRDSAGNFYGTIGNTGGQCVPYVRDETGIPWADFNGNADDTYQQAVNAGYATSSSVPRISSVIVFAAQGNMSVGHVGIVTAINGNNITIRDSNWNLDEVIHEHTVDISNYQILGYIYFTP